MCVRTDIKFILAATLSLSMALTAGCATEAGRGAMGGLVYGSMVGTTIVPGIGSAIGAGVGMLAGAIEGTQREREAKLEEETYRQKFYRLREQADEHVASKEGVRTSSESSSQPERFDNLVALQERRSLENILEQGAPRPAAVPSQTRETGPELNPPTGQSEKEEASSRLAKLYRELAEIRRERRELESKVERLDALLEEYNRSDRKSPKLLSQMEDVLELSAHKATEVPSPGEKAEIGYLRKEYELARRQNNVPLAESIARRYEVLSGRKLHQGSASSIHPGF